MTNPSTPEQPDPLWFELVELATDLADQAGSLILEMAEQARSSASTKSTATDVVTKADEAAERLITNGIVAARSGDGIIGEEGATRPGTSPVVWHIDPIDGTTNYLYGVPAFSVSIAAAVDDTVVAGVVLNPVRRHRYVAVRNGGATCNGAPLSCSPLLDMGTALVATGFGYHHDRRRRQAQLLVEVLPRIRDIRRFGSAALDLCAVAAGEVDAYYERGLNRWDFGAGALVAAEAGAVVANLNGGEPDTDFVLAASPGVFDQLRELLVRFDADSGP